MKLVRWAMEGRKRAAAFWAAAFFFLLPGLMACAGDPAVAPANVQAALRDGTEGREAGTASEAGEPAAEGSELQVHYIDVGQGDATLILCGGEAMLIDAGDNSKGTTVQLYLQKQGVSSLKYMIGTHPDADHIGGMDVIITKFDCDTVIMPDVESDTAAYRDVIDAMEYRNYKNTLPVVGDTYALGDASFTIIAPNQEYPDPNNCSVGILLIYGSSRFLFTGDAETEAEEDILKNGIDVSADVLKAGHHGSSTSTGAVFLDAVSPSFAVISCGRDNAYGHPHEETLSAFQNAGIEVFRTDEQGSIIAVSDGKSITWNTAPSDPGAEEAALSAQDTADVSGPETGAVTYVLNHNTKKFHVPDCSSVKTIQDSNREDTSMSREEILEMGYAPCKRCNP